MMVSAESDRRGNEARRAYELADKNDRPMLSTSAAVSRKRTIALSKMYGERLKNTLQGIIATPLWMGLT